MKKENEMKRYQNWIPTPDNINNLPEKVRGYIHDIEANGDPAGTIQDNACLRENVKALSRKCKVLEMKIDLMSFYVPEEKMERISEDAESSQCPIKQVLIGDKRIKELRQ